MEARGPRLCSCWYLNENLFVFEFYLDVVSTSAISRFSVISSLFFRCAPKRFCTMKEETLYSLRVYIITEIVESDRDDTLDVKGSKAWAS